jgi:hypothetical protein
MAGNLNLLLYLLLQVVALEKLSDQSGTPKAGQVFPAEFFLNALNLFIVSSQNDNVLFRQNRNVLF